jgi:hypothetical protein
MRERERGPHAWHSSDVANGFAARRADVGRMLVEGRRELLPRFRAGCATFAKKEPAPTTTAHRGEPLLAEPQEDLAFALIQMTAEMLERVTRPFAPSMRVRTGTAWIVARSSVRHGSKRCHLLCVAGIAKRVAKTSSTVIASNCSERCQASAREVTRESCRASATWCAPNALSSIASRRESVVSLAVCGRRRPRSPRHERRV